MKRSYSLWGATLLTHLCDILTTILGRQHPRIVEQHPAGGAMLESLGVPGLLVLKAFFGVTVIIVWLGGRYFWPDQAWVVPAAAAASGLGFATWNVILITSLFLG